MKAKPNKNKSAASESWLLRPTSIAGIESQEQLVGLVQTPKIKEFLSASVGLETNSDMPDWAVRAAKEFGNTIQKLSSKRNSSDGYELGFIFGIMSNANPPEQGLEKPLLEFISSPELQSQIHADVRNESAEEKAEFYEGLADGLKSDVTDFLTGQMKVFLLIGLLWELSGQCKNVKELHAWIEGILGANLAGTRDRLAKICQKIKFPLNDKGGRPTTKPRKRTVS